MYLKNTNIFLYIPSTISMVVYDKYNEEKTHRCKGGGGGVNETPNYAVILVGIGLANKLKKKIHHQLKTDSALSLCYDNIYLCISLLLNSQY